MRRAKVEVIGVEPPCRRCQAAKKAVEKAAEGLKAEGIQVHIEKTNIMSKTIFNKYGVLVSPALAINGVVKIMGSVPTEKDVERLIREAVQ